MNFDLSPGDYRERKPKGWRWNLPWSHQDDVKLPMVGFFATAGFEGYFFCNLPAGGSVGVCIGIATFAFCAGGCLVLWLRD